MSKEEETSKQPSPADGISIMVSASKMKATVEVDVNCAEDWSAEKLSAYVMAEGVVYGIDDRAISDLFEKKTFNESVVVAKGTQQKDGEDGSIRHHIDVDCLRGRPRVLETGGVSHRELGLFEAVEEGQLLAERVHPTAGVPGRDVYGNEIAATDGKEAKLTGGKNTKLSEDGNTLVVGIEGCLTGRPEKIEVIPALTISGDVNYKTGNITSNVAVMVSGGILPDFSIKSDEDVNITGLVDTAEIVSGGRIAINAGIQGSGKAVLIAEKEILARFANETTLKAKGDIVIQGPITHCHIETQGHLIVQGGQGAILGGEIHANEGVTANCIGSEMGVKTVIHVGFQLDELHEKMSQMEAKRASLLPNVKKLGQLLRVFAVIQEKKGGLPPDKQTMAVKVKKTHEVLQAQVKEIEAELEKISAECKHQQQLRRSVNVKGTTWPGTQIRILRETFIPKAPMKGCTFTIIDNEIQAFAYRDRDKEKKQKKESSKSS